MYNISSKKYRNYWLNKKKNLECFHEKINNNFYECYLI